MLGPGQGSWWERLSCVGMKRGGSLGAGTSHSDRGALDLGWKEGLRNKTARIPCPSIYLTYDATLLATVRDRSGHTPAEFSGMVSQVLGGLQVEDSRIYRKGECVPSPPGTVLKSTQQSRTQTPGVPVPARTQE